MADPVKLALAGCGRIVQLVHLEALRRTPGVRVVAFAEPDPGRRAEAARRLPSAAAVADLGELLAMPGPEAVLVCLPTDRHAEAASAVLDAGKHLYLEKPIATGMAEARGVLDSWRRSGKVGMIGFNYRYHPTYRDLRGRIAAGAVGDLLTIRTAFSTPARALPGWKQRRETGGGVLLDLASHHVDLVRFLTGREPVEVSARVESRASEEDAATLELTLEGGTVVQSFFAMCSVDEDRVEVYGTSGKLAVDRHYAAGVEALGVRRDGVRMSRLGRSLRSLGDSPAVRRRLLRRRDEPSYAAAFAAFAAAVRGEAAASPDLEDGARSLAVIAAAEESARSNRRIRIPDRERDADLVGQR